jgi:hypothetical protein
MSTKIFKNCLDITAKNEVDEELIAWVHESFHLKDTNT